VDVFHGVVRVAGGTAALGFSAGLLLTRPTGRREVALAVCGSSILVVVVLSPVVHLWYFLWALPFLATRQLSRGTATALVALSVVGGLVAPLDSSLHGAYEVVVLGVMLVAGLLVLLLLTRSSRERLVGIGR
jgi:alpha-1,6-mannosyltransferase